MHITERTYLLNWIALLALYAANFGISFAPLGAFHTPVILFIAGIEMALIFLIFMGLIQEHGSIIVAVGVWVLLLAILILLTAADVATRFTTMRPPVSGP